MFACLSFFEINFSPIFVRWKYRKSVLCIIFAGDRSLLVREPGLPTFLLHAEREAGGRSGRRRGQTVQGIPYY